MTHDDALATYELIREYEARADAPTTRREDYHHAVREAHRLWLALSDAGWSIVDGTEAVRTSTRNASHVATIIV
jgi:hypothetical protein